MGVAPESGVDPGRPRGLGRLGSLVKDHPLLAVAAALGSIGTFAAGTANFLGLFIGGEPMLAKPLAAGEISLPAATSYEYVQVSDGTGQISVEVPRVWADVPGDGWHARNLAPIPENKVIGPGLNAAPNVPAWKEDLTTPGVFIGASEEILRTHPAGTILRSLRFDGCSSTASESYATDDFTGEIVTWSCPETGAEWRLLAATPTKSRAYLVYLQMKLVSSADAEAYNKILNTFEVDFAK